MRLGRIQPKEALMPMLPADPRRAKRTKTGTSLPHRLEPRSPIAERTAANPLAPKELLTIADVAHLCKVSKRTVFRWFGRGLRSIRKGRVTRIAPGDLGRFLGPSKR